MLSTPKRAKTPTCDETHRQLTRALQRNDREGARRIYHTQVVPNPAFDRREAERLSYRAGAIDEGDEHLANRGDL